MGLVAREIIHDSRSQRQIQDGHVLVLERKSGFVEWHIRQFAILHQLQISIAERNQILDFLLRAVSNASGGQSYGRIRRVAGSLRQRDSIVLRMENRVMLAVLPIHLHAPDNPVRICLVAFDIGLHLAIKT